MPSKIQAIISKTDQTTITYVVEALWTHMLRNSLDWLRFKIRALDMEGVYVFGNQDEEFWIHAPKDVSRTGGPAASAAASRETLQAPPSQVQDWTTAWGFVHVERGDAQTAYPKQVIGNLSQAWGDRKLPRIGKSSASKDSERPSVHLDSSKVC